MVRWLKRAVIAIGLMLLVGFALLRTPDSDAAAMQAKYGGALAHYVDTPQGRIHWRDEGPRNAPVLLLVHGSNASLHTWQGTVQRLEGKYRLISLDLPGHGLTGASPRHDYRPSEMVRAAVAVLDAAQVDRAVWVGNSMGGRVVWHAALEAPDRVAGLVLVDASGAVTDQPIRPYLGARIAQSWLGRQLMPYVTPRFMVAASLKQTYARPERIGPELVDRYWGLSRYPGNRVANGQRAVADMQEAAWQDIGRIAVPVLVVWGREDKVIPLSHAQAFARAIRGAELSMIADAGHLPMEERPDAFVAVLSPWLAAHWSPAQGEDQPS